MDLHDFLEPGDDVKGLDSHFHERAVRRGGELLQMRVLGQVPLGGSLPIGAGQLPGVPRPRRSHGLEEIRRPIRGVVDDEGNAIIFLDVRESTIT